MNNKIDNIYCKNLSYKIVGLAMKVHNDLGYGFLEKVYENALMLLFKQEKILAQQQQKLKVYYLGKMIGSYCTDILINNNILLELKSVKKITNVHRAQTLNYLKACSIRLAIILNFREDKLEYERIIK